MQSDTQVLPSAHERLLADLSDELRVLEDDGLYRRLRVLEKVEGPCVWIEGRELVSFCSNDYLGLSMDPHVADAVARACVEWGVGARASRLLSGTTRLHSDLEDALAAWFGYEDSIVFASGYLANLGALRVLLSSKDIVCVDRLAHASLIDAARQTGAHLRVFRHNDVDHLAQVLARSGSARRRIIVTEGIFSMDGDPAPLVAISEVAQASGSLVYLDDAHGAFVLGKGGRGSLEISGCLKDSFLYMGTLGKALGAQGGFVAGPRVLIDYLRNRARTFIYATALAVPVAAAAVAGLKVLREKPALRETLALRCRQLNDALQALSGYTRRDPSHIVPVIVGDPRRALKISEELWDEGFLCPAIRPPTVPEGSSRLRISLNALHTPEQVNMLCTALKNLCNRNV